MNLLTITGLICQEAGEKQVNTGHKLTMFSIVNSIGKGEKKEDVFWNVLLWGTRFDKILPWIKKGRMITVVGTLHSKPSAYQKGNETVVRNLQMTAEMIYFLPESKKEEKKEDSKSDEECPF